MVELQREAAMGGGQETAARAIPVISLEDFEERKATIADELWAAATEVGFFQLVTHDEGLSPRYVDEAFAYSAAFFALPHEVKQRMPLANNAGWEYKAQVRPSTGTADKKESYQITKTRMGDQLWPAEQQLPGFRAFMEEFERANWRVAMKVLSCFALKLGMPEDFFATAHAPASPEYQSTLRLLHYLPVDTSAADAYEGWRAGAHTDFDVLTMVHQRPGQGGLQVCPGQDRDSGLWSPVPPLEGVVTCNVGDMLQRWSDDRLQSTLHRVRMPKPGEPTGPRYSLVFFAQANKDVTIESANYPPITAGEFLRRRIAANFAGAKSASST
eukprot:CAMPEP_0198436118 /NCGR_PEP_ID=MMETSP1452-20131203/41060_1 /TAXON_ID=1181717 /ORGANISM="Synchroma pusillum, Strain CCMP3072" /LENGTH=327 /DNA_ID=CAMNT_0044156667 /DNA_START=1 /DNA_END=984 /DNA_ORIENTATION=+